jgi:ubiquinone/menaquinone biosynthesis C-methylase UbiE
MSKSIMTKIAHYAAFAVLRVRQFTRSIAQDIATKTTNGQTVLEIGSGWVDKTGRFYFSSKEYFENRGVHFIQSDRKAEYGHRVVDIATLSEQNAYDHILCFHVLDDVYEWEQALLNLYRALKPGGLLHIVSPAYTLLDEPADLFRFTERLWRECAKKNNLVIDTIVRHGPARYPFAYYVRFKK